MTQLGHMLPLLTSFNVGNCRRVYHVISSYFVLVVAFAQAPLHMTQAMIYGKGVCHHPIG